MHCLRKSFRAANLHGICVIDRTGAAVIMHIFIIEDEPLIRRELKILLENAMYQVTAADIFENLVNQVQTAMPDLILMDVNLPGISGFDLCIQLREQTDIPVIFLTGRTDSMDELNGILKGADDYITKPYQPPLLLARIAAVLKRTKGTKPESFSKNGVTLHIPRCCLSFQSKSVELTKNEMKILHLLFLHEGEFVSRITLVEYLWENQIFIDDNTLSVHVTNIRKKLNSIGAEDFIETKRGIGYRI